MMARASAHWLVLVTEDMVADACVERRVRAYQDHVPGMVEWPNSVEASWVYLYLQETLARGELAPSPWFGD